MATEARQSGSTWQMPSDGLGRALSGVQAGREVPGTGPCELHTCGEWTVTGGRVCTPSLAPCRWQSGLHGHEARPAPASTRHTSQATSTCPVI